MYKQKLGAAIGTKFAPAYANLFMSSSEEDFLSKCEVRSWTWYWYIDNICFIETDGEEMLFSFVEYVNSYRQTIKFPAEISKDSVSYLDVLVSINGRALETDLYYKSAGAHQYCRGALDTHGRSKRPSHTDKLLGLEGFAQMRR